jgi:large repetitive protein
VSAAATNPAQALVTTTDGTVFITPHVTPTVTVTYTVANPDGQKTSGAITVTVSEPEPVNPAPVAVDDSLTVSSGGSGQVNVLANDSGYDDTGDVLTVKLDKVTPASFGTVTMSANGMLSFQASATGSAGQATVPYSLSDGHGPVAHGNVVINVQACTESPPQAKPDPLLFTPYRTPISIDLSQQVVSGVIDQASINGAITHVAETYTPPAGENGVVFIYFDVVNSCHQVAHGQVSIDVNRTPIGLAPTITVPPGGSLTILPSQIAQDDELGITISGISGQPGWVSRAGDGSSLTVAPPAGTNSGNYAFSATVTDPGGLSVSTTVTLVLNNQPPTALDDVYRTTESLYMLNPSPIANDFDPEGQGLTIRSVVPRDPTRASVQVNGDSVIVNVAHGVSVFDYTIQDAGGLTANATITVTSNHAPSMPDVSGETSSSSLNLTLSPTDPDPEDQGTLWQPTTCAPPNGWDYQLLHDPDPGPPAIPDRLRLFVFVAAGTGPGTYNFTCTTRDPFGATATANVSVTVDSG